MDDHLLPTYLRAEPVFVRGIGARLFDESGKSYLDLLSGIGVTALGHAHPRLVAALREQVGELTHISNLFRHAYTNEVATRLAHLTGLQSAFFCNSGSEAVETAIKIARKAQKLLGFPARTKLVALEGGFHGRTYGALSVTANAKYRAPFEPTLETTFVPPGDTAALEAALAQEPAALVLEPLQGEGGLNRLSADYMRAAREACTRTGTVLVHDEIQCGCGRTGRFLCGQWSGVVPDVVTLAKPLAAGIPMAATLVCAQLAEVLGPGDHGSTFGGGPLASRAALVFLDELEVGGLMVNVAARGEQLARGLDAIVATRPGVTERRGTGLMQGIVVPERAAAAQTALFEGGLVCCTAAGDVLRFLPPYIITSEEVEEALALLDSTLGSVLG